MAALEIEPPTQRTMPLDGHDAHWKATKLIHDRLHLAERVRLIALGVPYDIAMALEAAELAAYSIAVGEAQGGEWDWSAHRWLEPDTIPRHRR